MSTGKTGGTAFPNVPDGAGTRWDDWEKGMTLRQYYVAKVISGMLSNPACPRTVETVVNNAFYCADAMIKFEQDEQK